MPSSETLRITLTDARGRRLRLAGLAAWLRRVAPARARGAVTIALVSDAHMRRLNRQYRRKDYATDVLTFLGDANVAVVQTLRPASASSPKGLHYRCVGDIVIAKGVARRQAREIDLRRVRRLADDDDLHHAADVEHAGAALREVGGDDLAERFEDRRDLLAGHARDA